MTIQIIDPKNAVESLKRGERIAPERVRFNEEMVEALDAMLLREHGVAVPDDLVFYDDDAIDYSDNPAWTDEELSRAVRANTLINSEFTITKAIPPFVPKEGESDESFQMRRFAFVRADVLIEKEVAQWLTKTNANLDHLLADLLNEHYKNLKANSPSQIQ